MINLVIQSFGREYEYRRAVITAMSFFSFAEKKEAVSIFLFTDNPVWFHPYFSDLPVYYILLTPEKISDMRGKIDFLHRMKIAIIEEAFKLSSGNIIYSDSDVFFIADPLPLAESLTADKSYMHLREYEFGDLPLDVEYSGGKKSFRQLIGSQSFSTSENSNFSILLTHSSWNAGVMIFHPKHVNLLPDVYSLTEQIYPCTLNHASEQYSFSIMLQTNTELKQCEHIANHYWYRIEKEVADLYLVDKITAAWAQKNISDQLTDVTHWTKELTSLFKNHVLILKDKAIQAFNENKLFLGYQWSIKAILKGAHKDRRFVKDILYHTKKTMFTP